MKLMKRLLVLIFILGSVIAKADEGMWLPQLLQKLNENRMKSLGMKISAADIYNINKGSLKDAIVSFGGFCTGEIISSKGLLLTNHHCGFDAIQDHSTLEKNYIRDGFWARNHGEEIPNPNLFVTFIVRIDDVSAAALKGVTAAMSESERQSAIDKNLAEIRKNVQKEPTQESFTRGFFEGNQYYLFVTETFKDVRLVGAPPSSIGNFGKDTDNWMWPRHTGDFSMFRIYASKDNKPADYSPENVPYIPKKSLSISMDGIAENDFTMIFGFPGQTRQYLPAVAVEQIRTVNDPAKIAIRDRALKIIDGFMRKDEGIKIQYAAKYASIQNAYKKWQGEVLGLTRVDAYAKKKAYESTFQQRVNANPVWISQYGTVLADLEAAYNQLKPYGLARDYYQEIVSKLELFAITSQLNALVNAYNKEGDKGYQQRLKTSRDNINNLLKEYSPEVDRKLYEGLLELYVRSQDSVNVSPMVREWLTASSGNYTTLSDKIFAQNLGYDKAVIEQLLNKPSEEAVAQIKTIQALGLLADIQKTYQSRVQTQVNEIQARINKLQRLYMQAQMDVFKEKVFYPDANSTLRVTYGKVGGYSARDAVKFDYYTTLDGLMDKYKPGDYEFDVPEKLRTLYSTKDFGPYASKGSVPVCFIASNHTTGGNSGSPALDAYGNLIGLNFDRVWEGTMSDINYDPSICRNIMVDIRYVLFIVDKFAGAKHLIDEMKLVHPKKK